MRSCGFKSRSGYEEKFFSNFSLPKGIEFCTFAAASALRGQEERGDGEVKKAREEEGRDKRVH